MHIGNDAMTLNRSNYLTVLMSEYRTAAFWRDVVAEFVATFFLVAAILSLELDWTSSSSSSSAGSDVVEARDGGENEGSTTTTTTTSKDKYDEEDVEVRLLKVAVGCWFTMTALVWIFSEFGGAHMNPAVTLGFALSIDVTAFRGTLLLVNVM